MHRQPAAARQPLLLHANVCMASLLVTLEGLRRSREFLHDHVRDADSSEGRCSLCHLKRSLSVATKRAARAYDSVEAGSAALVDQDTLDVALVGVRELLDGQRPLHLARVGKAPQRAARN